MIESKSELAYKYAPSLISFAYLLFAFHWYEHVSVGLLFGHQINTIRLVATGTSVFTLGFAILFITVPFIMVMVVWKYWSEQEGSPLGILGTLLTSVSAGFSTVLLAATAARRGLFLSLGNDQEFLQFPYGVEHISAFSVSSEQAKLWIIASVIWLVIMLTGYLVRRGHLSISFS